MSNQGNFVKLKEDTQQTQFVGYNNEGWDSFKEMQILGMPNNKEKLNLLSQRMTGQNLIYEDRYLKNIFSRQLPKMPKEYIVKLVFDRNHQALVILKNNQKVEFVIDYIKHKILQKLLSLL